MKQKNFRKKAILYGIVGLLCLINITKLWIFFLIFAGISALYFWLASRHKNDKNNIIEQAWEDSKEKKKRKKKKLDLFAIYSMNMTMATMMKTKRMRIYNYGCYDR